MVSEIRISLQFEWINYGIHYNSKLIISMYISQYQSQDEYSMLIYLALNEIMI